MADIDVEMDKAELKKLLTKSKKEPVHCCVGTSKGLGVIMLDKIKPAKSLVKDLEKKFADLKNPRWGSASVDTEEDPKLVILSLNKSAPGLARALKKTLKGTGFSKVEIRDEEGNVVEKEGEEEEDTAEPGRAAPAAAEDAQAAPPQAAAAEPEAAQQAAPEQTDTAASLTAELTALIKQLVPVMTAEPARGATLKPLAATATTTLKSGDLAAARIAIDALKDALSQPSSPGAGAGPADQQSAAGAPPNAPALSKARLAWSAARTKMESELNKLHAEMADHYKDTGFASQLDQVFSAKTQPILVNLDGSLSDRLAAVIGNTDPAQHPKLIADAKDVIGKYEKYLAGEPMIAKLDSNPFVPLAIQKTLSATLAALSRVVA